MREEQFEQMQLEMMLSHSNVRQDEELEEEKYEQGHFPGEDNLAYVGLSDAEIAVIFT